MLLVAASVLMCSCGATEDVKINKIHFPDAQFREYVSQNFDRNGDHMLSKRELSDVSMIDVSNKGISSLKGMKYFKELTSLMCNNSNLSKRDLSNCVNDIDLSCDNTVSVKI